MTFSGIFNSLYSSVYTAPEIEKLLATRQDSLEEVAIPDLLYIGLPDLSMLCELKSLHIHASSVFHLKLNEAWNKLQAPRLHHLTIDLASDIKSASSEDFGYTKAEWLKELLSISNSTSSRSSLGEIFLKFAHDNSSTPKRKMYLVELWDSQIMDDVATVAVSYNVSLTYGKPLCPENSGVLRLAMDRLPKMVYDYLLEYYNQNQNLEGLVSFQIANRLNLPETDTFCTLELLLEYGVVFTTIDEYTFAPLFHD